MRSMYFSSISDFKEINSSDWVLHWNISLSLVSSKVFFSFCNELFSVVSLFISIFAIFNDVDKLSNIIALLMHFSQSILFDAMALLP